MRDKSLDINTDSILDQLAGRIRSRGLEIPAVMVLETIRPLAGSISLLGEALVPLIAVLFGLSQEKMQQIIEDRELVDKIIIRLEQAQNQGDNIGR